MSMSLRSEPRWRLDQLRFGGSNYTWENWYRFARLGADAIHSTNPDVLIFLAGMEADTTLAPVIQGLPLSPGQATFDTADFAGYADKLVLEIHVYSPEHTQSCTTLVEDLSSRGVQALHPDAKAAFPVVVGEFGFLQDG